MSDFRLVPITSVWVSQPSHRRKRRAMAVTVATAATALAVARARKKTAGTISVGAQGADAIWASEVRDG